MICRCQISEPTFLLETARCPLAQLVISVGEGGTQGDTDGSFAKRCIVNDCVFRAKNVWKGWSFIAAFKFDFSQLH